MGLTKLSAYDTFIMYMAVKNHFNTKSYDFFKYQGKVRISPESFGNRRDRFHFASLSRKYSDKEMLSFLVANIFSGSKWVGELLDDAAKDIWKNFERRQESITYFFQNDINELFDSLENPKDVFEIKKTSLPVILEKYLANRISPETFVILDSFIGFSEKFNEQMADDIIWSTLGLRLKRLAPFIRYDKDKMKKILKDKLDSKKVA